MASKKARNGSPKPKQRDYLQEIRDLIDQALDAHDVDADVLLNGIIEHCNEAQDDLITDEDLDDDLLDEDLDDDLLDEDDDDDLLDEDDDEFDFEPIDDDQNDDL